MEECYDRGKECLNKYQLGKAEQNFLDVLRQCDITKKRSRVLYVHSILHLAFIYHRASKSSSCTPTRAFFHQLHASSLLRGILEFDEWDGNTFQKERSKKLLEELEGNLCEVVRGKFEQSIEDKQWLYKFKEFVNEQMKKSQIIEAEIEIIVEPSPEIEILPLAPKPMETPPPDKMIKVDKVQGAIKALVNEILLDRQRKRLLQRLHKKFGRRNERLALSYSLPDLTEIPEIRDILEAENGANSEEDETTDDVTEGVFEDELKDDEKRLKPHSIIELPVETIEEQQFSDDDSDEQTLSDSYTKVLTIEEEKEEEEFCEEVTVEWKYVGGRQIPVHNLPKTWNEKHRSKKVEVTSCSITLRIYPGLKQKTLDNSSSYHKWTHKVSTFEPTSPLNQIQHCINIPNSYHLTPSSNLATSGDAIISQLLSIFYRVAKLAFDHQLIDECRGILDESLLLLGEQEEKEQDSRLFGSIVELLARIECSFGEFEKCVRLFEEAIEVREHLNVPEVQIQILQCYVFLGDAYLSYYTKDGAFFSHLLLIVKRHLENEEDDDDDETDYSEDYSVSVWEAIKYYKKALYAAHHLKKKHENKQQIISSIVIQLNTKLADCYILIRDFDTAVENYEYVLCLLRNANASTTLRANAHVLSLLATTTFLIGNHAKAASIFECAAILQQHLSTSASFSHVFMLTLLGVCRSLCSQHHKAISACLKAFERFSQLYTQVITNYGQFWFIVHLLYILGDSYCKVALYDKALFYLHLSKRLLTTGQFVCKKQLIKSVKRMGDVYSEMNDIVSATKFYDEAISISDNSLICDGDLATTTANMHVDAKQYAQAGVYYEKARDQQKNMQDSMKIDYSNIQMQLANTCIVAGDFLKAIECYEEAIETMEELVKRPKQTISHALYMLALLKSDYIIKNNLFERSIAEYPTNAGRIFYAYFLLKADRYAECSNQLLDYRWNSESTLEITKVSQNVLRPYFELEIEDSAEFLIHLNCLAAVASIISYSKLNLSDYVTEILLDLVRKRCNSVWCSVCLMHAFFYSKLYKECLEVFQNLLLDGIPEEVNISVCSLACMAYILDYSYWLVTVLKNIQKFNRKQAKERTLIEHDWMETSKPELEEESDSEEEWRVLEEVEENTPDIILSSIDKTSDYINANGVTEDLVNGNEEVWIEETVETPSVILEMLKCNSTSSKFYSLLT
ncbi:unnamed protein product [Dimorphilus gyrociliatus]|uniref:Uncharacterized protein n=1 Tax=Dimorphilus gyrociliatus TaxID=2664684 RepID=A0A7I8W4V8_9ANNE|nr:unnamed protein product [Dimorphilus gyrociliatus]